MKKSQCCKAPIIRKGRANYRCSKCDKDVTLELMLYQMAKNDRLYNTNV